MKAVSSSVLSLHSSIQLAVILLACRLVRQLVKKIGQPQVVGEMIAGVLLGPSLLGLVWPSVEHRLFPARADRLLRPRELEPVAVSAGMWEVGS